MKIVFAGTPEFAANHLQALIQSEHQVCAVYTQPDRPSGRGKKIHASAVKQLALAHDIPVEQPTSLRTPQAQQALANYNADIMVVVAYGLLLPKAILDTPALGCINVHGSILPRWRGAAPIQRAIEAGDTESGITIMQMDEGLDTGDTLLKAPCAITADDTSASLHDRLCCIGPIALIDTLNGISDGSITAHKQDDANSCYAKKIEKHEAVIDWSQSAEQISRRIRAFQPFPICYGELDGQRVKIHYAKVSEATLAATAGAIFANTLGTTLCVACGPIESRLNTVLVIDTLQLPGKKPMSARDYLNGHGIKSKANSHSEPHQIGQFDVIRNA